MTLTRPPMFRRTSSWDRLREARRIVEAAGMALMSLRGAHHGGEEAPGGQLKTAVDHAAEGWVLGYLQARFPDDIFLSEEMFERVRSPWGAERSYWTVDALDGTRSFVGGFAGFCVQVAYVWEGRVDIAVIHEPTRHATYWAVAERGAFVESPEGRHRLTLQSITAWPPQLVFADSTHPAGRVGKLVAQRAGGFLECGSIGLKICRVAEGAAQVFAKALTFKLWDVAPGDLILHEAGGRLGLWTGQAIPYDGAQVSFRNILASCSGLFELMVEALAPGHGEARYSPRDTTRARRRSGP